MSELLWRFTLCLFILFLFQFRLLSVHLLGKSCSLGLPYVLIVFWLLVILVISLFGFEGGILVLVAPDMQGVNIIFSQFASLLMCVSSFATGNS